MNENKRVEFISYNGEYPNLCSGVLIVAIEGRVVALPAYACSSGGACYINDDGDEYIEDGPWYVNVPDEYTEYKDEIEDCMNENVNWGCCGGCL